MNNVEFGEVLSKIWNSSEYHDMMVAKKKKERRMLIASVLTMVAVFFVISVTIFAANSRKTDMMFSHFGFEQSVIKVGNTYYLLYTGDKKPLYGEYNGKKYYLGDYKSLDFEKVDNILNERTAAYKKVVEEYGDYSYTVETDGIIITHFNDADVINAKIAEKMSADSIRLVSANENDVEGKSLTGNILTLYVFEGSGGDVLFIPARYPSSVRFYVAAEKINAEIEEKTGEVFYGEILNR